MNSGNELYLISDATCIQREIHMFKFHQSGLSLCFMTPYQPAALFVQKVGAYLLTLTLSSQLCMPQAVYISIYIDAWFTWFLNCGGIGAYAGVNEQQL